MSDTLAERQAAFLAAILDERAPLPAAWGNRQAMGMQVYRGNYRSALIGALESTFERTCRYVGEAPFKQAAINHAIQHPPSGWTIDEAGKGFDATCAALFANNPEVAQLAWLEWAMLELATAPDCEALTPQAFAEATAGFADEDWMALRFDFQPRSTARGVTANLTGLWPALEEGAEIDRPEPILAQQRGCIAWREGERPTFKLVDDAAAAAFTQMQSGASYGEMILALAGDGSDPEAVQNAAMQAGAFLGDWLSEGMITALRA